MPLCAEGGHAFKPGLLRPSFSSATYPGSAILAIPVAVCIAIHFPIHWWTRPQAAPLGARAGRIEFSIRAAWTAPHRAKARPGPIRRFPTWSPRAGPHLAFRPAPARPRRRTKSRAAVLGAEAATPKLSRRRAATEWSPAFRTHSRRARATFRAAKGRAAPLRTEALASRGESLLRAAGTAASAPHRAGSGLTAAFHLSARLVAAGWPGFVGPWVAAFHAGPFPCFSVAGWPSFTLSLGLAEGTDR